MCIYSTLIKNPKYKSSKKNGGNVPPIRDSRAAYVPIGCKQCIECRKEKAREWGTRLQADIKDNRNGKFVTFTLSDQSYAKLAEGLEKLEGYTLDNAIITKAIRLFLERWRKKFGKSVRHFMVSELGHNGTENIHLHGILWTDEKSEVIKERWGYGFIWDGNKIYDRKENYVNIRTVNYIIKYITKVDVKHKGYISTILTSAGIGANYPNSIEAQRHKYREGGETDDLYRDRTGRKRALPIYWKNKFFSEEEREKMWLEKLDKMERWVMGERIDISNGLEQYEKAVLYARKLNKELGYSGEPLNWEEAELEKAQRKILQETRIMRGRNKERLGGGPVKQKGPDVPSGGPTIEGKVKTAGRGKKQNSQKEGRNTCGGLNTEYKKVLINKTWYEIREDGIKAIK